MANKDAVRKYKSKPGIKEKLREKRKERYKIECARYAELRRTPEGWAKETARRIRSRTKKNGLEFEITWKDIIPPTVCPVLGIPLVVGGGMNAGNSPSVDRIDNTKGYVIGNVKVVSIRANSLKKDATLDELRQLVAYMERELNQSVP